MNRTVPALTLNNGVAIPALGFGVYRTPPARTTAAVRTALADGYRLIDTAAAYGNEQQVGEAIAASGVPRDEVFVATKLWITDYGYQPAIDAFAASAGKLGVDYVDLYLLHQPVPSSFGDTIAAYQALETLLANGKVRAIGVSNFGETELAGLQAATTIVPAVNQVEIHPYFIQQPLRRVHDQLGILTEAWSPIGGVNVYWDNAANTAGSPLQNPVIGGIARRHGKTPAQVILRWHLQHGTCAIPKSVRPERIAENIDVFDFELSADELAFIDGLDTGVRGGPDPASIRR
jgi:2,5-diketo-D-gluconate reductase A